MKILNRRELQYIALNHSADINFKDFMNIYGKYRNKPYSFLTIEIKIKLKLFMIILKEIKLNIMLDREAATISASSFIMGKQDKHKYLTGEDLSKNQ